jgi:crotonobetainyl-CoA:carnitine CoA-transferase CaiB-like acyl-CoA transferase
MGREDLMTDPRMVNMNARVANMEIVDDMVASWTRQHGKQSLFALLIKERVPCAPVRDLKEVVADPHMHARGMLEEIDHPEFGAITVGRSPLRFDGSPIMALRPSPRLGGDNENVFSNWLGLSGAEVASLSEEGAI